MMKSLVMFFNTIPCFLSPSNSSAIEEFVLIPQHTTPANTTKELDALYDVLQHVRRKWETEVRFAVGNQNCWTPLK